MKKLANLILIAVVITVVSCGDDKSKLEKMKAEYEKMGNDIRALEAGMTGQDTMTVSGLNVSTLTMKKDTFKTFVEIQGSVDGEENVMATPKTLGVITQIYVQQGEQVRKGQVLAQIDASVLEQTLKEVSTSYEFIKDLYERQKSLWDQKIGSEVQYLSAKNNKESLELKIKTLNEQLDMYKITSPIDGSVEDLSIKVGQSVAPGMPAFRIVNFSRVKIVADVSEAYSGTIKKGDEVLLHFITDNIDYKSNLSFASRFINPVNRTFRIETYVDPKLLEFRANMIAVVKIRNYINNTAISVPVNVVLKDKDEPYLYVAEKSGNKYNAVKRQVKTGRSYNGKIEIVSGLSDGDIVVTSSLYSMKEGDVIAL